MALRTCPDCGKEVSKRAPACPSCGAPIKRKGMGPVGMLVGTLFTIWVIVMVVDSINDPTPSGSTARESKQPELQKVDKSPEMQAGRERLINDLQQRGLLGDVQCRGVAADMWVKPAFMLVDLKDKESFAGVVYAWCFDTVGGGRHVNLKGTLDGKNVGRYNPTGYPVLRMN